MTDIQRAKRALGRELRSVEGFVGIGVGSEGIRLYASEETAPVVQLFRKRWGSHYEGFAVAVVLSDGFMSLAEGP